MIPYGGPEECPVCHVHHTHSGPCTGPATRPQDPESPTDTHQTGTMRP